jgi:hypothetical protein
MREERAARVGGPLPCLLVALAARLGIEEKADQSEVVTGLFNQLRRRNRWLLVYDNAERPDRLAGLLPPGGRGRCW